MRFWTDKMKDEVATYLKDGWSASQIGRRMGFSRNAIIGVVGRTERLKAIGFVRMSGQVHAGPKSRSDPKPAKKPKPAKPVKVVEKKQVAPVIQLFESEPAADRSFTVGRPISELRDSQCKWPVNDAEAGELHLFCGSPALIKTYCSHHWNMSIGEGTLSERTAHRGIAA